MNSFLIRINLIAESKRNQINNVAVSTRFNWIENRILFFSFLFLVGIACSRQGEFISHCTRVEELAKIGQFSVKEEQEPENEFELDSISEIARLERR